MFPGLEIAGISAERLLGEWKWLVPGEFALLAVNAFGDLFLEDANRAVHWVDVTSGTISAVAITGVEFREAAKGPRKKRDWLLQELTENAERKGCRPGKGQCVGSKIPRVFKPSADRPDNMYVAYPSECVWFKGELHGQMKDVPDGQIRIPVQPRPDKTGPLEN